MAEREMDLRLLEERNGVSFLECLEAAMQSDLVTEWQRLSGKRLIAESAMGRMVDTATGYDIAMMGEFADFVYEYVFQTFPVKEKEA